MNQCWTRAVVVIFNYEVVCGTQTPCIQNVLLCINYTYICGPITSTTAKTAIWPLVWPYALILGHCWRHSPPLNNILVIITPLSSTGLVRSRLKHVLLRLDFRELLPSSHHMHKRHSSCDKHVHVVVSFSSSHVAFIRYRFTVSPNASPTNQHCVNASC